MPHHFRAHGMKMQICHQGLVSKFTLSIYFHRSQNLQKRARHTWSLLQRKHDEPDVWMVVLLSVSEGALPMIMSGEIATENLPLSKASQAVFDSQHTKRRESYVRLRKVRHPWRVCWCLSLSRTLSIKNSKRWNLWGCPEDLTSPVMALSFLTLSVTWKHISTLYQVCPWGKRLWELFESAYCHTVVIQKRWHSTGNEPATCLLQKSQTLE